MNTQANRLHVYFFEGDNETVTANLNGWLAEQEAGVRIVGLEYNYQAPEVDGQGKLLTPGMHGILVAFTKGETRDG